MRILRNQDQASALQWADAQHEVDLVLRGLGQAQSKDKDIEPSKPDNAAPTMTIHQLPAYDGIMVSIEPPISPETEIDHVPVDIVLVIDVSGSMSTMAPVPQTSGEPQLESPDLSLLDLVKHSARTIVETMNQRDRLGIVAFSSDAEILQGLETMTAENKERALKAINGLRPQSATNLWAGIRKGLKVFSKVKSVSNVQAMYILTDGAPNHMCPVQGYSPRLQQILSKRPDAQTPAIHTFGFGYSIRSDLMRSIAEVGSGTYSFIPDAGMIGTVFVHAVANLYSTFAWNVSLAVDSQMPLVYTGNAVSGVVHDFSDPAEDPHRLTLDLGKIQYGQSRDITLKVNDSDQNCENYIQSTSATLTYTRHGATTCQVIRAELDDRACTLPSSTLAYHNFRHELITLLHTLCPWTESNGFPTNHHYAGSYLDGYILPLQSFLNECQPNLQSLTSKLQSFSTSHPSLLTPQLTSLLSDLTGEITLSISSPTHYRRWGRHYLASLLHAHMSQFCNSFKDAGPLQYGTHSPLFQKCRTVLDEMFDNLPAPVPTHIPDSNKALRARAHFSMAHYNNPGGACFLGENTLLLADGASIPVEDARQEMRVWTPAGSRVIRAVLETECVGENWLCRVRGLWVTMWHPIYWCCQDSPSEVQKGEDVPREGTAKGEWVFPANVAEEVRLFEKGTKVYSLLLERDGSAPGDRLGAVDVGHAVAISGVLCVTLGHGLTNPGSGVTWGFTSGSGKTSDSENPQMVQGKEDIRTHAFFGDWDAVDRSLRTLPRSSEGVYLGGGVKRDRMTGLVVGFVTREDAKQSELDQRRQASEWREVDILIYP